MAKKETESRSPWAERLRPWLRHAGGAVMVSLVIAALGLGIAKLRDARAFPIRTVQIEGEFRYLDRGELEEAATPHVRGGFFSIDLGEVERALLELPWVHSVTLRRRWPESLVIRVREQVPVALWGEAALLNPYGEMFHPPREQFPEGLPRVRGPEGKARELLKALAELQIALREHGLDARALSEDPRRSREIELVNGIEVALGRADHGARVRRLLDAYPDALAPQEQLIRRIDLRYTNGLAVEWKSAGGGAAASE